VDLYLNPPDKAIVLSVDEKSQIQALDRTQPILPLRPGLPERQTHDYERHGTTTLFAALDVAVGKVIGQCQPRHRHQEFLRFLEKIDAATPANTPIHLTDPGQLRNPQTSRSEIMVRKASPVPRALHPDQCLLAESGRTLVRRNHANANPTRNIPVRKRPREGYTGVYPRQQQSSEAIPMGRQCQQNHREGPQV